MEKLVQVFAKTANFNRTCTIDCPANVGVFSWIQEILNHILVLWHVVVELHLFLLICCKTVLIVL